MASNFPDFNLVVLHGNLARDPESKDLPSGTKKVTTAIALTKPVGGETMFVQLTFFNNEGNHNLADRVQEHFTKGTRVIVQGKLVVDTPEIDGQRRTYVSVVVDDIRFAGGKRQDSGEEETGTPRLQPQRRTPAQASTEDEDFVAAAPPAPKAAPAPTSRPAAQASRPAPAGRAATKPAPRVVPGADDDNSPF